MSFPKLLIIITILLFGGILILSWFKKGERKVPTGQSSTPIEVTIIDEKKEEIIEDNPPSYISEEKSEISLPDADRISMLFNKGEPKLPIVETIAYKSRVPWMKGRAAWLSDYASYYHTSRHFIARSLNGRPDYLKQDITEGKHFNVMKLDKDIEFYLLVDASRCKMWFYYHDKDSNNRVLLKTYTVGLGRPDSHCASGLLTPLGKFTLGDKVALYKPKVKGYFNGDKVELIRVFGTRWVPFNEQVQGCTAPPEGLGIHGVPWVADDAGELYEDISSLGKYESDGCIRLATEDIEEVFAIVITKPTTIEIVKDFSEAKKPGIGEE